jgi:beta-glucosidase/6-phospho-beta-glucosidase/beta-galactosidase
VCDESDFLRLQAIQDYAQIVHQAIQDGIDIKGYYFWSTWDNFEWHLGALHAVWVIRMRSGNQRTFTQTEWRVVLKTSTLEEDCNVALQRY